VTRAIARWALRLGARFDWARDPALFVATSVTAIFVVALVVAAVTSDGGAGGRGGSKSHIVGRHGRVSMRAKTPEWSSATAPPRDATRRWAELGVPDQCLKNDFTPTAVIPGLELHELDGERAFYLTKEAKTTEKVRTANELEEEETVKEELKEAKKEMKEAEKTLESEIVTEEEELKIISGRDPLPNVVGRRKLLDDDEGEDGAQDVEVEVPTSTLIHKDGKLVRRYRFQNPLMLNGMTKDMDWRKETTERQIIFHAANITGYDARCQFKTMQCADMATDLLARALKADAAAVVNPQASAETLKRLSTVLIKYSNDPRTKFNASDLPSLGGAPQGMGTCAWTTEAEYNPETGERYNGAVSRFATAIDAHDTAVYCNVLTERKYCKFTMIRDGPEDVVTVELDEQAYESARKVGRIIHDSLSADLELGSNVVGWGYRGDPSPAFVALLMLLRSNRCARVDVYGQPGVPIDWYHNARGYAHMVAVPGTSKADSQLSRVLLQEKFFYRTLMHYGKMCFFK
jgi:hypothetical protein